MTRREEEGEWDRRRVEEDDMREGASFHEIGGERRGWDRHKVEGRGQG